MNATCAHLECWHGTGYEICLDLAEPGRCECILCTELLSFLWTEAGTGQERKISPNTPSLTRASTKLLHAHPPFRTTERC